MPVMCCRQLPKFLGDSDAVADVFRSDKISSYFNAGPDIENLSEGSGGIMGITSFFFDTSTRT